MKNKKRKSGRKSEIEIVNGDAMGKPGVTGVKSLKEEIEESQHKWEAMVKCQKASRS